MPSGVTIEAELRPAVTWHGRTTAGVVVVLKKLPDDCLRKGELHPLIALRLTRLREAPLTATAGLIGVERTDLGVVTVSEFVAGTPLSELPPPERGRFAAEARRLVAALHRFGLVHGAVNGGNLIRDHAGRLRLIDPSPLLYDDPATDAADLAKLFPDDTPADAAPREPRWQARPLLAAVAIALLAAAAAGAWAAHTAGVP